MPAPPGNPLLAESFAKPTVTYTGTGEDASATVTGGPSFDLDPQKAAAGVAAANAAKAEAAAMAAKLIASARSLDSTVSQLKATIAASNESVLGVLAAYSAARTAVEKAYAARFEALGQQLLWTRKSTYELFKRDMLIDGILGQIYVAWENRWKKDDWRETMVYDFTQIAVDMRVDLIAQLVGDQSIKTRYAASKPPWARMIETNRRPFQTEYNWMNDQVRGTGRQLWYSAGYYGLRAQDSLINEQIVKTRAEREAKLGPIRTAHAALTAATDSIFLQQAALAGVTSDLYDRYAALFPTGPAKDEAGRRVTDLAKQLTVPVMNPVTVQVSTSGFTATVTPSWSASHASGTFEYLFGDGSGFYSNGGAGSFTSVQSYLDVENAPQAQAKTFSGSVRGGIGFRATQGANYTINWPEGVLQAKPGSTPRYDRAMPQELGKPVGTTTHTDTSSSASDKTPPSRPVVTFDDAGVRSGNAWLLPTNRVHVTWSSADAESGISEYSVAVGTTSGGTDITPWQVLGGRTDRILEEIQANGGKTLYVSVKAKNGAGLTSDVGTSAGLRIDGTPPVLQQIVLRKDGPYGNASSIRATQPSCTMAPPAPIQVTDYMSNAGALISSVKPQYPPQANLTLPVASDPESGIKAFYWKADTVPITTWTGADGWRQPPAGWGYVPLTGAPISYTKETYVTVAAMNYAGAVSLSSAGPFHVLDPYDPPTPTVCADVASSPGYIALRFGAANDDPETGTKYYMARVLNQKTGAVVQDWARVGNTNGSLANTNVTLAGTFPDGVYTVDVQAVNGHDMRGDVVRTTPLYVDRSGPDTPTLTAAITAPVQEYVRVTFDGGQTYWPIPMPLKAGRVVLTINAPADAQSGLKSVQIAVGSSPGGTDLKTWTDIGTSPGTMDLPVFLIGPDKTYYVMLRSMNNAGMTSNTFSTVIKVPPATKVYR